MLSWWLYTWQCSRSPDARLSLPFLLCIEFHEGKSHPILIPVFSFKTVTQEKSSGVSRYVKPKMDLYTFCSGESHDKDSSSLPLLPFFVPVLLSVPWAWHPLSHLRVLHMFFYLLEYSLLLPSSHTDPLKSNQLLFSFGKSPYAWFSCYSVLCSVLPFHVPHQLTCSLL